MIAAELIAAGDECLVLPSQVISGHQRGESEKGWHEWRKVLVHVSACVGRLTPREVPGELPVLPFRALREEFRTGESTEGMYEAYSGVGLGAIY